MIDTLVFDLGNVLIAWNPRNLFASYFNNEEKLEYFLSHICTMEWNEEQDKGRTVAEATQVLLDKYPEWAEPIRLYYGRWTEMISGQIQGTVDILKRLHQDGHYRLLALTNWSAELFPWARANFDFLDLFEGILVSGEEKMKKPDLAIYERFIEKFQADPSKCLFIDDSAKNIKGAHDAGWQAILFKNPEQLLEDLSAFGIRIGMQNE